jgi:hypothetical protein
VNIYQN